MSTCTAASSNGGVQWLEGSAAGTFTARVVAAVGTDSRAAVPVDMDGDGDQDVVSASIPGFVIWHENDGAGAFTPHLISNEAFGAISVGVGDMNGDGLPVGALSADPLALLLACTSLPIAWHGPPPLFASADNHSHHL